MSHWLEKTKENPEFVSALEALGLTPDNAVLVAILPLVYVAWADGSVSTGESRVIFDAAGDLGIKPGKGQELLSEWLEERPSPDFFAKALKVFGHAIEMLSDLEKLEDELDLVTLCERVARATGGFLGLFSISGSEKTAITQIKQHLKVDESQSAKELFEELRKRVTFYDK